MCLLLIMEMPNPILYTVYMLTQMVGPITLTSQCSKSQLSHSAYTCHQDHLIVGLLGKFDYKGMLVTVYTLVSSCTAPPTDRTVYVATALHSRWRQRPHRVVGRWGWLTSWHKQSEHSSALRGHPQEAAVVHCQESLFIMLSYSSMFLEVYTCTIVCIYNIFL